MTSASDTISGSHVAETSSKNYVFRPGSGLSVSVGQNLEGCVILVNFSSSMVDARSVAPATGCHHRFVDPVDDANCPVQCHFHNHVISEQDLWILIEIIEKDASR